MTVGMGQAQPDASSHAIDSEPETGNQSGLKHRSCHTRAGGNHSPHWLTADEEMPKIFARGLTPLAS